MHVLVPFGFWILSWSVFRYRCNMSLQCTGSFIVLLTCESLSILTFIKPVTTTSDKLPLNKPGTNASRVNPQGKCPIGYALPGTNPKASERGRRHMHRQLAVEFCLVFRLRRMREMQIIATDVPVCHSVCHVASLDFGMQCKNGWTDRDPG